MLAPNGADPSTVSSQTETGPEVTFLIVLAALVTLTSSSARAGTFSAAIAATSEQAEPGN